MRTVLDPHRAQEGLAQVAEQLATAPLSELVLVGVRRGGVPLASRLATLLAERFHIDVPVGSVDITLYRDDAATALPNPRIGPSQIPVPLDGRRVLLVDDVLYTRRTIRAAFDAVFDYGRPAKIELFVLVDRGGGQLPIQADYCVCRLADVGADERVDVLTENGQISAVVQDKSAPSIPPPRT